MAQGFHLGVEGGAVPGVAADEGQGELQSFAPEQFGGVQQGQVVFAGFVAADGEHDGQGADAEQVAGLLLGGVGGSVGVDGEGDAGDIGAGLATAGQHHPPTPVLQLCGRARGGDAIGAGGRGEIVGKAHRHALGGGLRRHHRHTVVPDQTRRRSGIHDKGLIVLSANRLHWEFGDQMRAAPGHDDRALLGGSLHRLFFCAVQGPVDLRRGEEPEVRVSLGPADDERLVVALPAPGCFSSDPLDPGGEQVAGGVMEVHQYFPGDNLNGLPAAGVKLSGVDQRLVERRKRPVQPGSRERFAGPWGNRGAGRSIPPGPARSGVGLDQSAHPPGRRATRGDGRPSTGESSARNRVSIRSRIAAARSTSLPSRTSSSPPEPAGERSMVARTLGPQPADRVAGRRTCCQGGMLLSHGTGPP